MTQAQKLQKIYDLKRELWLSQDELHPKTYNSMMAELVILERVTTKLVMKEHNNKKIK